MLRRRRSRGEESVDEGEDVEDSEESVDEGEETPRGTQNRVRSPGSFASRRKQTVDEGEEVEASEESVGEGEDVEERECC